MIATASALADFLPKVAACDPVAIDTEADSLHCYFEKLCLIQFTLPGNDILVDPLANMPLASLFAVLAEKELIFHGADYDLRLLRRVGFHGPRSIFDTMIAARLTGHAEFSLAALISKHFGVTLAKGSQKANWARRPLPPQMEDYAKNDTHYLHELREKLSAELRTLGRFEWFQQMCVRAIEIAQVDRERDVENAWRITGSNDLQGRGAALLRALWRWRDAEARSVDRPAFHILQNDKLIESAQKFDSGQSVVVPHLSSSRARRFFQAAEAALRSPEDEWPQPIRKLRVRPTPEQDRVYNKIKARRDQAAVALQLDPSLIAPKATLEAVSANPDDAGSRLLPWQRELLEI